MSHVINHLYEFGDFRVDSSRRLLLRNDEVIPLTPKVFDTLLVLLESGGRVMEKEDLIRQVWNNAAVEEVGLTKNISALRRALGESPAEHQYIVTVPGRGYRFVADVREVTPDKEEAEEPVIETDTVTPVLTEADVSEPIIPVSTPGAGRRGRVARAVIFALVLSAVGAAFFYFHGRPVLTPADTILLTDFVNQTGDPVFDLTLREGLAVQLEQSPLLNIFPEERVRGTLRLMRRPPDERVTEAIAVEICRRDGLKALVTGLIAPLGSHYAITLEAIDSRSGNTLARVQEEAAGKEQVLQGLSRAASTLRRELGESVRSIQKFDALLEHTTSSLEALRAYSLGHQERMQGHFLQAIPFYRRAIELDPAFAYAYAGLSALYSTTQQLQLAAEYATKAYQLRDRTSELEKLAITSFYYGLATGEAGKRLEVLKVEQRIYPRDPAAYTNMASTYSSIGQFEQSVEEARIAIRLSPNSAIGYGVLGNALVHLNRFSEARELYDNAIAKHVDAAGVHRGLFQIAFMDGDRKALQQQIQWAAGRSSAYRALDWQARAAAYGGQARLSAEYERQGIAALNGIVATEVASEYAAEAALREAALGRCEEARTAAAQTFSSDDNRLSLTRAALALAWCDRADDLKPLMDELIRRFPRNTVVNGIWIPEIRATLELKGGHAESALEFLKPVELYEAAAEFWPQYLRGEAYLHLGRGGKAEAEFWKILNHRGQDMLSPLYPLARIGLAKSVALEHDPARARECYKEFLAEWRDADADMPALIEAKKGVEN